MLKADRYRSFSGTMYAASATITQSSSTGRRVVAEDEPAQRDEAVVRCAAATATASAVEVTAAETMRSSVTSSPVSVATT